MHDGRATLGASGVVFEAVFRTSTVVPRAARNAQETHAQQAVESGMNQPQW